MIESIAVMLSLLDLPLIRVILMHPGGPDIALSPGHRPLRGSAAAEDLAHPYALCSVAEFHLPQPI